MLLASLHRLLFVLSIEKVFLDWLAINEPLIHGQHERLGVVAICRALRLSKKAQLRASASAEGQPLAFIALVIGGGDC